MTGILLADAHSAKKFAANRALEHIDDGMRIGLGSGSTALIFVRELAYAVVRNEWNVTCVSTSSSTSRVAIELGLGLSPLNEVLHLDIAIDGADEIDPGLNLVKGGGGALLQEKIVAAASETMIVIADSSKLVESLGSFPLPVEVTRFGWKSTMSRLRDFFDTSDVDGSECKLRGGEGDPYLTDEGNFIVDASLGRIGNPEAIAAEINCIPGVVENGLFANIASSAIVGWPNGDVEVLSEGKCNPIMNSAAIEVGSKSAGGMHV